MYNRNRVFEYSTGLRFLFVLLAKLRGLAAEPSLTD